MRGLTSGLCISAAIHVVAGSCLVLLAPVGASRPARVTIAYLSKAGGPTAAPPLSGASDVPHSHSKSKKTMMTMSHASSAESPDKASFEVDAIGESAAEGANADTPSGNGEASVVLGSTLGLHVEYPRLSRILGEEGTAVIKLKTENIEQRMTYQPILFSSSGHARLDEAALNAVKVGIEKGLVEGATLHREDTKICFIFSLIEKGSTRDR